MPQPLENGDRLPAILAKDLEGNEVDITATLEGAWSALLLYRGHW